jgi:hypothetical protein
MTSRILLYGETPKVKYTGISRQRGFVFFKRRKEEEKEIGIRQT